MITDQSFSPGFQTVHFKSTNVPGNLVTVVRMDKMPSQDDVAGHSMWIEELLALVSKEHGGTYEIGDSYKAGSYDSGTNLVIYVRRVSSEQSVVSGAKAGMEQGQDAASGEQSTSDNEGGEGTA